jgi:NCK-associated protein 1
MVRGMSATQQKLGEKLTILNDRGIGMLTRIYNIKKACSDAKSKPAFLSDKTLESCIKHVVRKFPVMDTKTTTLNPVFNIKTDIMKSLSLYYYTFVDLLDYKDHVSELLTIMDQCQLHLDITINYDLTKGYLDLVVTYVSLLVLLSRVEDRKAVLGLFNTAHEMTHGHSDPSFPRLGSMIIDYEAPMKKLSEEFVPHAKLLFNAVMSLNKIFCMRNLPADEWRKSQILSLVSTPSSMLNPAQTDVIQCEYLSLDAMERYLYFGFLLIHPCLQQPSAGDLFQKVLQCGWVTTLFRDEVVQTHPFAQQFFESMKGHNKRVSDIKDAHTWVNTNICHIHRERRKFLRSALKELGLILSDQPGLLGPKALLVFMALSFARDEIHWLLRHYDNPKSKKTGVVKSAPEELLDRQLPELLFHVEELRALVRKYNQVIQRYYVQYLTGYDAVSLNELMQGISMMPEEDSVIVESVHQQISSLSVKQVENTDKFDFRGLRLDWFRLQAYTSVSRYPLHLFDHRDLAVLMNMIVFHTKMIDSLDDMLTETSDLSLYCFYSKIFDEQFHQCLEFPAQTRFIIAFPIICGHFMTCNHDLCPEERYDVFYFLFCYFY